MVSRRFLEESQAETTDEIWLVLLTFSHPDLAALAIDRPDIGISDGELRLVANDTDIVSNGRTFMAYAFEWIPPGQSEQGRDAARIRLDNVDRRIVEMIRLLKTSPEVTAEIVLASDPDVVEQSFPAFIIPAPGWSMLTIEADLKARDDDDEPAIAWTYSPRFAPGLH
jgi:hypothetical protein